ncbi:hypothetical protein DL769_002379 [Monosporascus sp. CRB-8-3]|nr:hypothetical protein DL769_002379 [Monosporascus sp. CRB-8-3]
MTTVYKDVRYTRERSPSSDEEKFKSTTVRRYKVDGSSVSRIERYEDDEDARSRYSHSHAGGRASGDLLEVDRRVERTSYTPDRPRSAYDAPPSPREREFEYHRDDGDRHRSLKYESREVTSPRGRERRYPWDDPPETEMRLEKRVEKFEERRDEPRDTKEKELRIERRVIEERDPYDDHHHHHHHHHDDIERYRREVEYYAAPDPPPAPIVIRQKAPEQKVIVHEAAPVILPPQPRQEPNIIVLRDEHREVSRRNDNRAEEEYWRRRGELDALERYERRRREERQYESDGVDEDYYIKRTVIRRERSSSSDHKKRHLAEGALAGAGLSALMAGGRDKESGSRDHRGRKVLAGAALGALGTAVARRAKSAYDDRYHDEYDYEEDDHHRSRSKSRSRLKTGLAIGAAALAVAGGLKYMQDNKSEKEEATRGRSRRRYSTSTSSGSRSRGRSRSKSKSNAAKAALATSAAAGLVHHFRSKSRGSAEIAAAGLTGAAATKLWERHKNKKDRKKDRGLDDAYYSDGRSRSRSYSRSRSRSRSRTRSPFSRPSAADRELGLVPVVPGVEYGSRPIDTHDGYASPTEDRRRRSRRRRRRSSSSSDSDVKKKRSRSKLRDVAAGVLGTGAAAIGIKKYQDHQKSLKTETELEVGGLGIASADVCYEDEEEPDLYYSDYDRGAPSSPHYASGGYPPPPATAPTPPSPGPAGPGDFTQHSNQSTMNLNAYPPPPPPNNYNPRQYTAYRPPSPGPPPPGAGHPLGPENVSHHVHFDDASSISRSTASEKDGLGRARDAPSSRSPSPEPPTSPRVKFVPLSPQSSQTLRRHREEAGTELENQSTRMPSPPPEWLDNQLTLPKRRPEYTRRRSDSDPSSDRPATYHRRRRRRGDESSADSDVEVLPDRFDEAGRPLGGGADPLRRWSSRRGEFEYRPRDPHRNGWDVRGAWGVGGTDTEVVDQIAHGIGDVLEGRKNWTSLVGTVLKGALPRLEDRGGGRMPWRIGDEDADADAEDEGRKMRRKVKRRRRRDPVEDY